MPASFPLVSGITTNLQLTASFTFGVYLKSIKPEQYDSNYAWNVYTRTIPTSLTQYIFAMFYELVLVWDALRAKNTIQIIGLCLCNFGLMIYGAVQVDQIKDSIDKLNLGANNVGIWDEIRGALIVIPCILGAGTVLLSGLAWKLYDEFAWTIYKHISADLQMKRRYLNYQVCSLNCQL